MILSQKFPKKLDRVKLANISTSELWFIKEQYEHDMIPVMYGPIELRETSYMFYLLGNGDQIYGATVGDNWIVGLRKIKTDRALQMITLWNKSRSKYKYNIHEN